MGMLKAIFSLFCVAALFNSGLVLATPTTGDTVAKVGDTAAGLAKAGIKEAAEGLDGIEKTLANAGADLLSVAIDKGTEALGNHLDGDQGGKQGAQTNTGGNQAAQGNNGGNQGVQNNNGGNQKAQANIGGNQGNGGNTVQISAIGMFLVLAIFNH